jgi:hypothetical protein
MAQFWLCELGSLKLVELVESEEDLNQVVHSSKGAGNEQRYFALPEGVYSSNCKLALDDADPENPVYSLEADAESQDNNPEWLALKAQREELLKACDWTQLEDSPLSAEDKASWATYRQSLRDIPQDYTEVESVVWPEQP